MKRLMMIMELISNPESTGPYMAGWSMGRKVNDCGVSFYLGVVILDWCLATASALSGLIAVFFLVFSSGASGSRFGSIFRSWKA